jgi:2-succinyl-6-hydroxy-2,4-cyclohexadiene-1-carboxylate synthase
VRIVQARPARSGHGLFVRVLPRTVSSGATESGSRLVLLHGFTQTHASFGRFGALLVDLLADAHEIVLVDLPGHGTSSAEAASVEDAAALLARALGPASWLGYSLGGRIALRIGLDAPEAAHALILISASAGIVDPERREARRARDAALAARLEAPGASLEAFIDEWLAQPMFRTLPREAAARQHRLGHDPRRLARVLRTMGQGASEPSRDRLSRLAMPVLALAGALDVPYALEARDIARSAPRGAFALVPGAGHACHLERPELAARIVASFLGAIAKHAIAEHILRPNRSTTTPRRPAS